MIIHVGDALQVLGIIESESIPCVITSPPYFGIVEFTGADDELGQERTVDEYVGRLSAIFSKVFRVLTKDGVVWLNMGDTFNSYGGTCGPGGTKKFLKRGMSAPRKKYPGLREQSLKPKDLIGVPWRVALRLQADGWFLRSEIIWKKSSPAPEPAARDRPYRAHETIFLLAKRERSIRSCHSPKGDSSRTIWEEISNGGRIAGHPADFPISLVDRCLMSTILRRDEFVLDPFCGSGTTLLVAARAGLEGIGIEIKGEYAELAARRIREDNLIFPTSVSLVQPIGKE